ncbi:hypothetical protein [Globicatella sanguinis]|uniref:hypothetical protein n=1 Tax=Globicatella sanguinis TaxID=13076 RepID=UPI0025431AA8|nr:hypothetical protein [Globicatella sanguinis]MDK7631837.1 hypothetical protein [Globicatella sanguinis]WIK67151.1 hypothetical protein CYJ72_003420 [Globicatella sanguinis]WKT56556.1 hypothetical protein Q3C38_03420 [Globicatella sanguinis]
MAAILSIFGPFLEYNKQAALTDRLTHKSHVVNMVGPSYRMKETEQWIKDNSKMTVAQF